ncbi:hypothetical protein D3C81_1285940 [compost metagenome]
MGGRIDRHHLYRLNGVNAYGNGPAYNIIHMSMLQQILGNHIIGDENRPPGIHSLFSNCADAFRHVPLRGAFAHEHADSVAQLLHHFFLGGCLMAGDMAAAANNMGRQLLAEQAGGIALDGFADRFGVRDRSKQIIY